MNLAGTSLLNGIAVLTKVGTMLVLNKVLAVHVGPAGYGVIGQFQNVVTIASTLASGALGNGVVKYTAEHGGDLARQRRVWHTASTLGLSGAAFLAVVLVVAREPVAAWSLGDAGLHGVVIALALALSPMVLNGLLLAILNGRKEVRAHVTATIVGSLVTAVAAVTLVVAHGLVGALFALATSQAVSLLATAWLFRRTLRLGWRDVLGALDRPTARRLGAFALMGLTAAVAAPVGQLLIRDGMAARFGWDDAGLWQALWKISELHLLLLTSTLSLYFLPRFSEIRDGALLRREVLAGYRFVLPLVLASSALIWWQSERIVRLLLTGEFLPLVDAMGLQLLGDVLKIGSWVMAFTMISHAQTRTFIVTEIAFTVLLVVAMLGLASRYGLVGAAAGYAATYAVYWVVMARVFRRLTARLDAESATPSGAAVRAPL
jgi:polysaccharide transporter, PST family